MSSDATVRTARGDLFVISAPSGAGKTTLIRGLFDALSATGELVFSVSQTTRRPRLGEVDGRDYRFVDEAGFRRTIAADGFLEWAEVHGHLYGTAKEAVLPALDRGADVVVDIDVQGAAQILERVPEAHTIFVVPPTYAELEARLTQRDSDGREQIQRRLAVALAEVRKYAMYEYVIVNDDAARATRALAAIVLEKRYRRARMEARVGEVLADFERARSEPPAT
jgi:guanylate kinase